MKKGDKYLSGYLNFGVMGKRRVIIFKNENRKNENSPTHRIVISEGENLKNVGALWISEKKGKEEKQNVEGKDVLWSGE